MKLTSMRKLIILMLTVIAADSTGLIVRIKEKYGPTHCDTCTVLMEHPNEYICVKKDGYPVRYPIGNVSKVTIEKKGKP